MLVDCRLMLTTDDGRRSWSKKNQPCGMPAVWVEWRHGRYGMYRRRLGRESVVARPCLVFSTVAPRASSRTRSIRPFASEDIPLRRAFFRRRLPSPPLSATKRP